MKSLCSIFNTYYFKKQNVKYVVIIFGDVANAACLMKIPPWIRIIRNADPFSLKAS